MPGCPEPGPLEDLRGTVKPYGRHVMVCTGDEPWPSRVEEAPGLLGRMARDAKASRDAIEPHFKVTALRTPSDDPATGYDLIVFPDQIRYRAVDGPAWERIVKEHLHAHPDAETHRGMEVALTDLDPPPEPVDGHHITVCVHTERDDRCGDCGPLLLAAFREALPDLGFPDVTLHRSSHVGGHRFAGNVLVYPPGVWYGYVRPGDVHDLLTAHLEEGTVWEPHLRGGRVGSGAEIPPGGP